MSKAKILLLGDIDHAHKTWAALGEQFDLVEPQADNRADFLAECKAGKLDGVVSAYRTFASLSITGRWDAELVDALPASFKLIAHNGAGYDSLDPEALTSRRILATHVPTAVDDATADTGVFLLLGALRNFATSMTSLRAGAWRGAPAAALGHDPRGKLLGVLGYGGIGRNMARKCRAFGMRVAYHNRRKLSEEDADGAVYMGFDELLAEADVLSLNVPLNEKTRHMIDAKALAKCKKGVVIINTARGAVIDEAALVEALESGHIGSAGLDVFEEEPKIHPGLIKNERVMLLPHMGTWTVETQTEMEDWNIGNVRKAAEWATGKGDGRDMTVIHEQKDLYEEMLKKGSIE